MRHKFNYEEVLSFIRENGITTVSELRKISLNLYNQLYKKNLLKEVFPEYNTKKKKEERYEEIKLFVKENGITTRTQLQRKNPGAYGFLYNNKMLDEVFGESDYTTKERKAKGNGLPLKPLLVDYFRKWAEEEGTTVKEQARKYGYKPQWISYCEDNGLDINTGKRMENETEE